MKWLLRSAGVLLALVAILALVPYFIEVDDYIPALEEELAARLGQSVSIDDLDVSLLPLPRIVARGIAIGGAGETKVGKVVLKPDLWSLAGSNKTLRSIDFEDVTLAHQALGALVRFTRRDAGSDGLRVERTRLQNAVIKLEQGEFGPFDADVTSAAGGGGELYLATEDGRFKARVKPDGESYALEISAKGWTLPVGPAVRFDQLDIKGSASGDGAALDQISGRLYGGTLNGGATISLAKGIAVKGELQLARVELKEAAALFAKKTRVSGRLDAKPVFNANAAEASGLDEALRIETPFTVHNGVLHGLDLAAAGALLNRGEGTGETRFEELAGRLVVERRAYRFTQLRIASGSLSAKGHVAVTQGKALSGELNTTVKGTGTGIPLIVAGTLDTPLLYPNPKALIGAAAGTAVLGPGLGTAAGVKLGEIVEGLLGKKK
jgi:uncharacterized protein involved in outer membrane biogenesis